MSSQQDAFKVVSSVVSGFLFAHFPTVKQVSKGSFISYDVIVVPKKVPVEKESKFLRGRANICVGDNCTMC